MDAENPDRIDERRAATLLGLSTAELRRLSRLSGLGQLQDERSEQMVYTYEDLRRLCLLAAPSFD